ncbi:MAG: DUF721 domain-containing protein [Verrucomicrobia subdivision 3 bacterium]|nr:DUF721 domain-containing protein [Limisphaerales bacterium]
MIRNPMFIPALGPPKLSAKQQTLAQWRGIDAAPQERGREDRAKSLAAVMPKVLTTLRMERRQSEAEIVRVWNNLLDPRITTHAQPTGINNGTLFVAVDSNVWLDEIVRYRRKEILDRLQHCFGKELIARISFRLGG